MSVLHVELFRPGTATAVWFAGFTVAFAGLAAGAVLWARASLRARTSLGGRAA